MNGIISAPVNARDKVGNLLIRLSTWGMLDFYDMSIVFKDLAILQCATFWVNYTEQMDWPMIMRLMQEHEHEVERIEELTFTLFLDDITLTYKYPQMQSRILMHGTP